VAAVEARAKTEAANYAKRQIDLEMEKARIGATLNALKEEGEAKAALAAAADQDNNEHMRKPSLFSSTKLSLQRTSEYVNTHFNCQQTEAQNDYLQNMEKKKKQTAYAPQPTHPLHIEVCGISHQTPYHTIPMQRKTHPEPMANHMCQGNIKRHIHHSCSSLSLCTTMLK